MKYLRTLLTIVMVASIGSAQVYHPSNRRPSRLGGNLRPTSYRVESSTAYRLDAGDALAILVDKVIGSFDDPPIQQPLIGAKHQLPVMGYPFVVREDGTLSLPSIGPVSVRGLTVKQTQQKISRAYQREKILKPQPPNQVLVSLLRKRTVGVLVIHDDPLDQLWNGSNNFSIYNSPRRRISKVTLPADRADSLHAIAAAGAPIDAESAIEYWNRDRRSGRGLRDASVIDVPGQSSDVFYTGGLLSSGQFPIPKNGINVMQAIALSGGATRQGLLGPSDVYLVRNAKGAAPRVFRIDMQAYRSNPSALKVQSGDVLILRHKPGEIIGNAAIEGVNIRVGP